MQLHLLALLRIILVESQQPDLPENPLFSSGLFSSVLLGGLSTSARHHFTALFTPVGSTSATNSAAASAFPSSAPAFSSFDDHASSNPVSSNLSSTSTSTLSHWVGFAVTVLPYLRRALPMIVFALINVLCQEIRFLVEPVQMSEAQQQQEQQQSEQRKRSRSSSVAAGASSSVIYPASPLTFSSSSSPASTDATAGNKGLSSNSKADLQGVLTQDVSILLEGLRRIIHYALLKPGERAELFSRPFQAGRHSLLCRLFAVLGMRPFGAEATSRCLSICRFLLLPVCSSTFISSRGVYAWLVGFIMKEPAFDENRMCFIPCLFRFVWSMAHGFSIVLTPQRILDVPQVHVIT